MSKYWEKTVEYGFVVRACKEKELEFLAPLGGKEERGAGDGLFGNDEKLVLVEFKASGKLAKEELSKFTDLDGACEALAGRDGHHFFVYAKNPIEAQEPLPLLEARTYFSGDVLEDALDCFRHGINPEEFKQYVTDLLQYKKEDGRSSSGQISFEALENVVGIDASGDRVSSVSLRDYVRFELPDLAPAIEQRKKLSYHSSPGGP